MAFCREKNQKLLFKVDSSLKFRKWFKYGLKVQKLLYAARPERAEAPISSTP